MAVRFDLRGLPCHGACSGCHLVYRLPMSPELPAWVIDAATAPTDPDGYRPLTPCLSYGRGYEKSDLRFEHNRVMWLAARRLDAAYRRFQNAVRLTAHDDKLAMARIWEAYGDAELGVVSLHLAMKTAKLVEDWDSSGALPPPVSQALPRIQTLRNALEHGDERAMGRVRQNLDPTAISGGVSMMGILMTRKLSYDDVEFDIDTEARSLIDALREYLATTWEHEVGEYVPR